MTEEQKPSDKSASVKQDWQIGLKWLNTSGFRILIGVAVILTIALIVLAVTVKDPDARANVLTVGVLTILTIVVTTISALSNRHMVEIMERQEAEMTEQGKAMVEGLKKSQAMFDQNERSMMYSQAAYVTVNEINFHAYELGKSPEARVVFTNTGLTPAYDVRVYVHLTYKKLPFSFTHDEAKDMSDVLNADKRNVYPVFMGPNGDITYQDVYQPPLTINELRMELSRPLHFWGLATYVDIFGRERWTEFCYRKFTAGQTEHGGMGMSEKHNDADKPYTKQEQRENPN